MHLLIPLFYFLVQADIYEDFYNNNNRGLGARNVYSFSSSSASGYSNPGLQWHPETIKMGLDMRKCFPSLHQSLFDSLFVEMSDIHENVLLQAIGLDYYAYNIRHLGNVCQSFTKLLIFLFNDLSFRYIRQLKLETNITKQVMMGNELDYKGIIPTLHYFQSLQNSGRMENKCREN